MKLWSHQSRCLDSLREAIVAGKRRILVVSPTGSGKGTLATEILRLAVERGNKGVFFIHRREIAKDTLERLKLAGVRAGLVLPDHNASPYAPVQVCSVQTLTARGQRPPADVVICDETHHLGSRTWSALVASYPNAILVGLTATPERSDGKALSQFEHMIVAAQYSELIAAGLIVPARLYQPSEAKGSNLALDPVAAYHKYAPGTKGFTFVASLEMGEDVCKRFIASGVPARTITGTTPKHERDRALNDLKHGRVLMLINHATLTEGVNCPDATTCIIARRCGHASTYLQIVGRVLRSSPGKPYAIVLDLVGASLTHGLPTADRTYSLDGKAIGLTQLPGLTVCAACGLTQLSGRKICEGCGFTFPKTPRKMPVIYSEELRAVFDFESTPPEAKVNELLRLLDVSDVRGYSVDYVAKCYEETFGEKVPVEWFASLPVERRKREFELWRAYGESRGFRNGYAAARYKERFGSYPTFR